MKLATKVIFDREERAVVRSAYTHIRISFPDPTAAEEDAIFRALNAMVEGQEVGRVQIENAIGGFTTLAEDCKAQSERAYWRRAMKLEEPQVERPSRVGGVALIADPEQTAMMLAETRRFQQDDAQRAVELLERALRHVRD
jgi:hypothetical protein